MRFPCCNTRVHTAKIGHDPARLSAARLTVSLVATVGTGYVFAHALGGRGDYPEDTFVDPAVILGLISTVLWVGSLRLIGSTSLGLQATELIGSDAPRFVAGAGRWVVAEVCVRHAGAYG